MMIFYRPNFQICISPLWRARAWLLERMVSLHVSSGDLRWGTMVLGLQVLSVLSSMAYESVAQCMQKPIWHVRRIFCKARFSSGRRHCC